MWAAEDIEAVFDQDPQRVCILQGPVAAKWSMVKDEPVKDLLGNINKALIQRLLERKYGGDKFAVPTSIDYFAVQSKAVSKTLSGVTRTGNFVTFKFGSELPETESWFQALAGSEFNWLFALISSPTVVQGTSYVDNALRRILVPRAGQKVVVKYAGSLPLSVTVYGAARSYGEHKPTFKALSIIFNSETKLVDLTLFEERQDVAVPLTLQFQYCPSQGFAPIHGIASGRNEHIKQFYWKLWFGDNEVLPNIDIHENVVGPDAALNSGDVEQFCAVAGNQGESFKVARNEKVRAPMDFAIVTCWKVISIPSLHTLSLKYFRPS
jgi:fatty acid synthase subunit beta